VAERSRANGRIPDGIWALGLWISEPGKPTKVPPISARWIPAKACGRLLRGTRARRGVENLAAIQPGLKVVGRGLDNRSRLVTLRLCRFTRKVIQQTQAMGACGSNIDVSALGVLVAQPLDRLFDMDCALTLSQNHFASIALDADIEALAAHRMKLYAHQPSTITADFSPRFLRSSPVIGSDPNLT
jgi:hypothetical protein